MMHGLAEARGGSEERDLHWFISADVLSRSTSIKGFGLLMLFGSISGFIRISGFIVVLDPLFVAPRVRSTSGNLAPLYLDIIVRRPHRGRGVLLPFVET